MSVLKKLASEGYLTPDQVAQIEQNVATFTKAAEQDPEFLQEAIEKLGSPFSSMVGGSKGYGQMAVDTAKVLGATALVAGAANIVGDLYDTAKDSIMKSRRYKAMMDANPQLRRLDSKLVQRSFNTLHTFNPQYAADPTVAGEFVAQRAQQQGLDFNTLKNIVDASKNTRPTRNSVRNYVTDPKTVMTAFTGASE